LKEKNNPVYLQETFFLEFWIFRAHALFESVIFSHSLMPPLFGVKYVANMMLCVLGLCDFSFFGVLICARVKQTHKRCGET